MIGGALVSKRTMMRTSTSAKTVNPSMKCHVLKPSRISLPLGKNFHSSIAAYTAAIKTSIAQWRMIDTVG